MKVFLLILLAAFLFYLMGCLFMYLFQWNFIFHPKKGSQPPPTDLNIEERWITTKDDVKLHAWWMPVNENAYTVLFFHGNAGNISWGEKRMRLFREMGFNALAVEYRGFGISTGKISNETQIYNDALTCYEYLQKDLGINETNIIIWGWSIGGAVAIDLAQNRKFHALVVESTFYSMYDIAKRSFGFLVNKRLLRYRFPSYERLLQIRGPILFIHSKQDEIIPYEQGRRLFDKRMGRKKFIDISGDHDHGIFDSKDAFMSEAIPYLTDKNL